MDNFNEYIHPFSIFYRNLPDISRLSEKYEKLKRYIKNNKYCFKKPRACRLLARVILNEYFSVEYWKIPKGCLVPAIPQRLNYLCWIKEIANSNSLTVLDVGTGANIIFPLLGARSFGWSFIASEKNEAAYKNAKKIVKRNNLNKEIRVQLIFEGILKEINEDFQVSICNPPFFEHAIRKTDGYQGTESELCTEGGEIKFIKQYIIDSWGKRRNGKIFSTMVGIKSHLEVLKSFLCKNFPSSEVKDTTLYQGKTIRWALAWKFDK